MHSRIQENPDGIPHKAQGGACVATLGLRSEAPCQSHLLSLIRPGSCNLKYILSLWCCSD